MKTIILTKTEDGVIKVTSDKNQIGTESIFDKITDESEQFIIALTDFLGYEPAELLNLDLD